MRIYKLTNFAHELNAALGSRRFQDISAAVVWKHIEDETIFEFLAERLGIGVIISTLSPIDRLEFILEWDSLRGYVEPFRFDGDLNGLCLLNGYLLEGIARRAQNPNHRLTFEAAIPNLPGDERDRLM